MVMASSASGMVGSISRGVRGMELSDRLESLRARADQIDSQIASEQQRTREIEEYSKYTESKMYIIEMAQKVLGLVFEDEILFKKEQWHYQCHLVYNEIH